MTEIELAAWHEAAHSVAALALGQSVTALTLGDDDSHPRCDLLYQTRDGIFPYRTAIIIRLAGIWGERLIDPSAERKDLDRSEALDLFQHIAHGNESIHDLEETARRLVQRYGQAIEHLAGELLTKIEMSGSEVSSALRGYGVLLVLRSPYCQRALKTSHRWALENQPL